MPPLESVKPKASLRNTNVPASRRRAKPQVSCHLCRKRKLRCDRQHPACSVCSARGLTCTYADNLRDRTAQLEQLFQSMTPQPSDNGRTETQRSDEDNGEGHRTSNSSTAGTPMYEPSRNGSMSLSSSEVRFLGSEHWTTIMDTISELKDHLEQEEEHQVSEGLADDGGGDTGCSSSSKPSATHASLLYHTGTSQSRTDIIASLPPKDAVDRHVARFFNSVDLVSTSVHGPTFLKEYERFWSNPASEMSIMWVGFLFGMICLAILASDPSANAMSDAEAELQRQQVDLYRQMIVHCLILGEYTKAPPYVLEAILNYVYIEFMIPNDTNQDLWYLLSLEVSLALKMGYHRDPNHFPGISPIQTEMRRRLWATVLLGDVLISCQMGMACQVNESVYDTAEPRNLTDDDLLQDAGSIHSRPETDTTSALGIIARRRVIIALRKVCELIACMRECRYEEFLRVDRIVQEASASLPPPFRSKSMAQSLMDSPHMVMARLFLGHIVSKAQIMLHRRFLFQEDDMYSYSRTTCLNSALEALEIHALLDQETSPGGQLHAMRFRVGSLMNSHFLSATMILCSVVHRRREPADRSEEIFSALQRAGNIWMRRSAVSLEAKKAAQTVSICLGKRTASPTPQHASQAIVPQETVPDLLPYDPILFTTNSVSDQSSADSTFPGMTFATQDLLQEMDFISAGPFGVPETSASRSSPADYNQQNFYLPDAGTNMFVDQWTGGIVAQNWWH